MSRKYNIKWKQSDTEELAKAVKNFNAKISRLEKKLDKREAAALPEKVSVKQLKELIDTRQDLKRELNALRRFSKRGAETLVTIPNNDYNLQTTKWQKEEMTRRIGVINRKRNKRRKELEDIQMTSGGKPLGYTAEQQAQFVGMGQADENSLKPMNAFSRTMTRTDLNKKFKNIQKESQSDYWFKKEKMLVANFIQALEENYDIFDIEDIVEAIQNMDFNEFYRKFKAEGNNFEFAYFPSEEEYTKYLTRLKSTWIPNYKDGR